MFHRARVSGKRGADSVRTTLPQMPVKITKLLDAFVKPFETAELTERVARLEEVVS
jgi:hypothetical protein